MTVKYLLKIDFIQVIYYNTTIKGENMFKIRNKRETGFEILRILAMLFIMLVHLLNAGGMLDNAAKNTITWHKLLYSFFTPSVNIFVLVSAYFMVSSKIKFKKLINLWGQVIFYCITSYLISAFFIYDNFSVKKLIGCFFPIINKKYWFFSAYFILMLLSPFLNKILNNSTKKELYSLCVLLFVLSYLYTKQSIGQIIGLNMGYSVWWFVCLYIFAGTLRLHPLKIKKVYLLIIYFVSTLLLWLFSIKPTSNYWLNLIYNTLDYTSPLVVISSISLLLLFKDINIKNIYLHNTLCYISTLTFGVYLIEGSHLHNYLHWNVFKIQNFYTSPISPLWVLIVAIETFVFCALIEAIRKIVIMLFQKIKTKKQDKKINN